MKTNTFTFHPKSFNQGMRWLLSEVAESDDPRELLLSLGWKSIRHVNDSLWVQEYGGFYPMESPDKKWIVKQGFVSLPLWKMPRPLRRYLIPTLAYKSVVKREFMRGMQWEQGAGCWFIQQRVKSTSASVKGMNYIYEQTESSIPEHLQRHAARFFGPDITSVLDIHYMNVTKVDGQFKFFDW